MVWLDFLRKTPEEIGGEAIVRLHDEYKVLVNECGLVIGTRDQYRKASKLRNNMEKYSVHFVNQITALNDAIENYDHPLIAEQSR